MGGIAGAGIAGGKAAKARKEVESEKQIIDENKLMDDAIINKKRYQDITERTENADMMRRFQEAVSRQGKEDAARSEVAGSTSSVNVAQGEARNKSLADAFSGIARNASMLMDSYDNQKLNTNARYAGSLIGLKDKIASIYNSEAANASQASSNAFSTAGNLVKPLAESL